MTMQTFNLITNGYNGDPAHSIGRADAYDDSHTHTIEQLVVRAGLYADHHPNLAYAIGYMDRVIEFRLEQDAVAAAESELAQTWLARKQGRETSTLHTRHHRR
ncbi:hypothetical protein [Streptomyces sp. NPDC004783]|uniref:hypothetical protein n=1 Tax=Streptomyces sp. NPDC004783 TaxID=3154459 RepID=UPI0033AC99CA